MTTEEIRRKAELRVATIGVNEETQKALVNWIVLTAKEALTQNTADTLERVREKWIKAIEGESDQTRARIMHNIDALTPTPLESDTEQRKKMPFLTEDEYNHFRSGGLVRLRTYEEYLASLPESDKTK
jgi:hypothetical protein